MQKWEAPRIRLIGPAMAPPVELHRWLLQRRNIAHQFENRAAGLHAFDSQRHRVPVELPLILVPAGAVGALLPSLEWLGGSLAERERLFPNAGEREFARLLCSRLFHPAVNLFYHHMLAAPGVLVPAGVAHTPLRDRLLVRALRPMWVRMLRRGLGLGAFDPAAAEVEIDGIFSLVETRLGSGAPFLGGAAPGELDIVFAALASPVILPAGHPAALPPDDSLPPRFRALVERLRTRPAGRLALRVYEQRPVPLDYGSVPPDKKALTDRLLSPRVQRGAARLFARFGPRVLRIRSSAFVGRWQDVDETLHRDSDFLIAPVNEERIQGVMGPFVLGMDASPRLYQQRSSLYAALRDADKAGVAAILDTEPRRLVEEASRRFGRIDVVNGFARPVAARVAFALFGIAGPTEQDLMRATRAVFRETFLNLSNDEKVRAEGRAAGAELAAWIEAELHRRGSQMGRDVLGRLAGQAAAGSLPREQVAWILAGLLVGAIDTTATAVANIVDEAMADDALRRNMMRDRHDRNLVAGWCWEALRRRPHNPLVLRQAGADTQIAGMAVPKGTRIWAMTLAAMQDNRAFPHPARLDATRPRDRYMHFGHALHRCSGRGLNEIQIPALVAALLDGGATPPADSRKRGPFPDRLVLSLEKSA